jgi:intron-binding protein aquarius
LWHFKPLSENTLVKLCESLGIRNQPVGIDIDVDIKEYLINVLVTKYEKRESQIKKISNQPLYPDEKVIFDDSLTQTQNYRGDRSIALPKLDLQFLTINDYLLRNHTLFRLGSICEVRRDIEDVVKRLSPRMKFPECKTEFGGKARMATLIQSFKYSG